MPVLNLKRKKKLTKSIKTASLPSSLIHAPDGTEIHISSLSNDEENRLREIVDELALSSDTKISHKQVEGDFSELRQTTLNIRQIQGQSFIQIGEKIQKTRELLKKYPNSNAGLTQWIEMVFGSQRTGFNILSLYEFFQKTKSKKIREKIVSIPLKAAYQIASREVGLKEKQEFVKDFEGQSSGEWLRGISERFPKEKIIKEKKLSNKSHFNRIRISIYELKRRKKYFTDEDFEILQEIIDDLSKILG